MPRGSMLQKGAHCLHCSLRGESKKADLNREKKHFLCGCQLGTPASQHLGTLADPPTGREAAIVLRSSPGNPDEVPGVTGYTAQPGPGPHRAWLMACPALSADSRAPGSPPAGPGPQPALEVGDDEGAKSMKEVRGEAGEYLKGVRGFLIEFGRSR